ncbi:MAG: hypothetical protein E7166_00460 [Firmicutes bacterium]|nr:hypothetical protein [Bacillota bacterium]
MKLIDEVKSKLYKSLLEKKKKIKSLEKDIDKYEILATSDDITFDYKVMNPDENWWIKAPYPCNRDLKSEYYEEIVKKLKDDLKTSEHNFKKLKEKLKIETDIYDRIFYYKYLEELDYKEVLQKTPYSESRFNVYYRIIRESLKKE